ncbi:RNA-binding protein pop5 [Coemansia helicoidea]|uniref:RNA-binding protein pop5 n=1 Tax=Coemansia helicoidea TaxID=1286919 RepID=A0ACC1L062_9FUNG|nr:RNA-binding protein pop5 [Coemansia helicoidea]
MVRFKNRYICFEILLEPSDAARAPRQDQQQALPALSAKAASQLIRDSVKLGFGDSGAGHVLMGTQVKYFGAHTRMGIAKVPRDHCKMVLAALTLATHVGKHPCVVCVRHVSGTIKKCQKAAIRLDRELIVAWHQRQRALAMAGGALPVADSALSQLLQESASQISALEL